MTKTVPPVKKPAKKPKPKKPTKADMQNARESARDKKARQRAAKRAAGFVEVSVWVGPEHADAVRDFAASLPVPEAKTVPAGQTLFEGFEAFNG